MYTIKAFERSSLPEAIVAEIKNRGGLCEIEIDFVSDQMDVSLNRVILELSNRYMFCCARLYSVRKVPLTWGFINNAKDIGAFSCTSSGTNTDTPHDFIGINVAVIFSAIDVCSRLLSLPDFMPEIGNPLVEDASRAAVSYWHENSIWAGREICFPIDNLRFFYALELASAMAGFIFFHEATHLANGHCEFIRADLEGGGFYSDNDFEAIKEVKRIECLQTLEIDADCIAAIHSMRYLHAKRDLINRGKFNTADECYVPVTDLGTDASIVRLCTAATNLTFRFTNPPAWDSFAQKKIRHPLPSLRQYLINPTFLHEDRMLEFGYGWDELISLVQSVVNSLEFGMNFLTGDERINSSLDSVVGNPSTSEFFDMFIKTWGEIRPYLQKYDRSGCLAPVQ